MLAIRSHQPFWTYDCITDSNSCFLQPTHARAPKRFHPKATGILEQHLMQQSAPDSYALAPGESGQNCAFLPDKFYAFESAGLAAVDTETEAAKRDLSIRHESFAAGFINGRCCRIRHEHIKPVLPRRNGCCQTGRAAANDEDIGIKFLPAHPHHRNKTNSEQNPGPMAASTL